MSKQDRQGVRQASDLEQKYNFGQTFAEIMGIATDARNLAEEANNSFENLDHDAVFDLLTDGGKQQGLYRGDNGELYINATYIKSGTIKAEYIDADGLTVSKLYAVDANGSGIALDKYGLQRMSVDETNPIIDLKHDWLQTGGLLQEMPYFDMFKTYYDRDVTPGKLVGGIENGVHLDTNGIEFRSNIDNFSDYPTHSYDHTVDFGISRYGQVTGNLKVETPTADTHAANKGYVDGVVSYLEAQLASKAPAGFGLGDKCIAVSSWDKATKNGFYASEGWFGYVTVHPNGDISQECFGQFSGVMHKRFRWYCDGAWNEWEWVNPRMVPETEYRTTERYNGKPVYVKKVALGTLPNANTLTIPHGISSLDTIVNFTGVARRSSGIVQQFPFMSTEGNVSGKLHLTSANIVATCLSDLSAYAGEVTIWYTKS